MKFRIAVSGLNSGMIEHPIFITFDAVRNLTRKDEEP
jgi:hypothetical protein